MPKFALKPIESVKGKQSFSKLLKDDKCQFDEYEQELSHNKKYKTELGMIYLFMEEVAKLKSLPQNKFKDITPQKETVKEYEFKTRHLRVYAIKTEDGKIIVLGGYKNRQQREIKKFRSIKKQYLESLNK